MGNFFVAPSLSLQDAINAAVAASILWDVNCESDGEIFEGDTFSSSTDACRLGPAPRAEMII